MVNTIYVRENGFHWTPFNLSVSILMGVAATGGVWISAGLLIMLFML